MVVDCEGGWGWGDLLDAAPGALEVAGVKEEHQLGIGAWRWLHIDLLESRQERVHVRQRWRYDHPRVLACGSQGFGESETAAEGVAVGILVSEDQDLLVGVDEVLDLVVLVACLRLRGFFFFFSL